jgi:hypothetical protein
VEATCSSEMSVDPKRLHSVISQMVRFITTAVRTSDPTKCMLFTENWLVGVIKLCNSK